jgi:glucose-6-phosphate isomerase
MSKIADYFIKIEDALKCTPNNDVSLSKDRSYRIKSSGITLDYQYQLINDHFFDQLFNLLELSDFEQARERLLEGAVVNHTENRAAWHTALRSSEPPAEVNDCLERMTEIVGAVRRGVWQGKNITDVVNIGIGGSNLGPEFICSAMAPLSDGPRCHFVSNFDEVHIKQVLKGLRPENTLFIIVSKSFSTHATLSNAHYALRWAKESLADIGAHFIAVTEGKSKAAELGICDEHILPLWNWVGGRYSIWSAVGLGLAISIGMTRFKGFLRGAEAMDQHFATAPDKENMPIVMALLGIWNCNIRHAKSYAIIPYSYQLRGLSTYLQQLFMESQGKHVDSMGLPIDFSSGPVIWGGVGTDSEHAFHQLLLQGTQRVPVDFIIPLKNTANTDTNQSQLVAKCLTQANVLFHGGEEKTGSRSIPGGNAVNLLMLDDITPTTLGSLLALYEHVVFVQSIIWGINPFDQWGVQLGKDVMKLLTEKLNEMPRNGDVFSLLNNKNRVLTKQVVKE